jgi:hypothetical protein
MRKPTLIPALVLPLLATPALAQDALAPAPAPVPAVPASAAVPTAPTAPASAPPVSVTWEGLVDTYYMYNFTGDPSTQGPALRNFDVASNSFSLAYAKLAGGVDSEKFAFRVDLGFGHTAAIINGASGLGSPQMATTPGGTPSNDQLVAHSLYNNAFLVQQAFGTLKLTPAFTVDAGRFVTSASAEVIEANKNWLYSRSLLFFGVPALHTGVRVNAQINPALKAQLSLVNGWNNDPDNNVGKTGGVSLIYSPPESGLTAAVNTYFGKEAAGSGGDIRLLVDGVVTKDIDSTLSVGANVDYLKQGDLWWVGGALMARYFLSDSLNLAVRGELIKSKAGAFDGNKAGDDATIYEGTAMLGYVVAKHVEVRAEGRFDGSNKELFSKGSEPKKNQITGTLAFLTYF